MGIIHTGLYLAGRRHAGCPVAANDGPLHAIAFDTLSRARNLNPSPYLYFVDLGGFQIVGSSPEILVRLEGGEVTVRPIAGTRKRGTSAEEDEALEADLLSDRKEIAEHLMLIDLGRNDVGRVAKAGSVALTEQMVVERYSHVMHIVSNVTAAVRDDILAIDALKATLPAGTLSGAPSCVRWRSLMSSSPSSGVSMAAQWATYPGRAKWIRPLRSEPL